MPPFQGTYASIKAQVISTLRLDPTDDDARTGEWVNQAYQQAVQETQALEQAGTADLTDNVASYLLPTELAQINEIVVTYQDGTVSAPLQRVPLATILANRRLTLAVAQQLWQPVYALVGQNQIELWPTPGAGQSMTFRYVYLPEELVEDDDEPVLYEPYGSKLLEMGALVEGARFLKDVVMLSTYETGYASWLAKYQVFLNRRNGASTTAFRTRGGNGNEGWLSALPRDVG